MPNQHSTSPMDVGGRPCGCAIYGILTPLGERGTGHVGPLDGLADTLGGWGYLMGSWPLWVVQKIWKRFVKMSRHTLFSNVRGLHSNGVTPRPRWDEVSESETTAGEVGDRIVSFQGMCASDLAR